MAALQLDTLWLLNGIIFYILLFSTDQWMRLVPQSWDIIPNAVSTAIQYASLDFPPRCGWLQYNGLQMIAYFTTVFVAAPLATVTGLLQSPAIAARFKTATGLLNRQVVRTISFLSVGVLHRVHSRSWRDRCGRRWFDLELQRAVGETSTMDSIAQVATTLDA